MRRLPEVDALIAETSERWRPERMAVLQEDEKWAPEKGVYNLPKTKYRRLAPGQSGPKRVEPKS